MKKPSPSPLSPQRATANDIPAENSLPESSVSLPSGAWTKILGTCGNSSFLLQLEAHVSRFQTGDFGF